MLLSKAERMIVKRYILPAKGERFIFITAAISLVAVMLGVAALVIVMSVMNGFRAELFDKIAGMNGHAVIQGYDGRLDNWQDVLRQAKATPGVTTATPMIEQPLMGSMNGRFDLVLLRGMRTQDMLKPGLMQVRAGSLKAITPGSQKIAIGTGLAQNLGAQVGMMITITNPAGVSTPFGVVPREISYEIAAIIEVGISEFDRTYVIMPMDDAQQLLLLGDAVGMIKVETKDPDNVAEYLAPLAPKVSQFAVITDWRQMNRSLFEALAIDRIVSFVVLSIIVLVAVFNILSSLIMFVRAKRRDIAILRTMGASRSMMLRIFITLGVTIGSMGTLAGLLLGFIFLFFRQNIVVFLQWVTGQNIWDPSIRFLTELPSKPDPVEITVIAVMALLFSFLATLYPALRAANTDPVEVLRYE